MTSGPDPSTFCPRDHGCSLPAGHGGDCYLTAAVCECAECEAKRDDRPQLGPCVNPDCNGDGECSCPGDRGVVPVESTPDGGAVETISRADLGKALRWASHRDWSISDEEHEAVENLADDAWNALTIRPRLQPIENGLTRPPVSPPVQVDGERPTLAELHARYLAARQHTLSTDGMDRDAAIEAQALYVLGEVSELHAACKHGTGGWGGTARHWRCEIADVVLATVSLANILGVTVEDCIAEKTEEDRGRG